MKKLSFILMSAAAAAMALVSCNKINEENAPVTPDEGSFQVTINTGETKTSYDPSANRTYWISSDQLGVVNDSFTENYQFTQASYDGTKTTTTFTGSVGETGTHYAYFPYNSTMTIGSGPKVSLSDNQVMPISGSFDSAADILVSEGFNVASTGDNDISALRFRRLGAFIDIQFKAGTSLSLDLTSEALSSVTITAESNLVGDCVLNPETGAFGAISNGSTSVYVGRAATELIYDSHSFAGVYPQTLAEGSTLIIDAETNTHRIHKEVTVPAGGIVLKAGHIQPLKIKLNDEDFVPVLKRVWGKYSGADYWYADVSAGGAALVEGAHARTLAMDDEYIYLPKSSAYAAVIGIKISDNTDMLRLPTTGMNGTTFQTSCARMIKNTNPSVNGGKDILLVSNLSAGDEAQPFRVYAYTNGIANAPVSFVAFIYDAANDTNDWRRYGDRFCVEGDWSSCKVYCPSFSAGKSVILTAANGSRTAVNQIWTTDKAEGIIDVSVYPGGSSILFTNTSQGLYASAGAGTNNGWALWPAVSAASTVDTWGYQFFAFNGKNYIARVKRLSSKSAKLQIFEDAAGNESGFITAISSAPLFEEYVQGEDSTDSSKSSSWADCAVHLVGGEPYIAALLENGGLSLFKMTL